MNDDGMNDETIIDRKLGGLLSLFFFLIYFFLKLTVQSLQRNYNAS